MRVVYTEDKYFFDGFSRLYLNSNQYVRMEVENYVTSGSSVLTITGGRDHVIDSIGNGAKNILAVDINKGQEFVCMLKILGVMFLNFDDYVRFFCSGNDEYLLLNRVVLDYLLKSAEKLKNVDTSAMVSFWKVMLENVSNLSEVFLNKGVSFNDQYGYLASCDKYNQAKQALLNFDGYLMFEDIDVRNLDSLNYPKEMFDMVYLHNLNNFMVEKQYSKLLTNILSYMKEGGCVSTYAFGQKKLWYEMGTFPDMFNKKYYNLDFFSNSNCADISRDCGWIIGERLKLLGLYSEFGKKSEVSLVEVPACHGYGLLVGPNDILMMVKKRKR